MFQLLQCISTDVITRGRLGRCIAVRVGEVIPLLQKAGMNNPSIIKETVETDMLRSDNCRRSQQKFIDHRSTSTDALLHGGGNRCIERCIIIKQSDVDSTQLQMIREGIMTYIYESPIACSNLYTPPHFSIHAALICSPEDSQQGDENFFSAAETSAATLQASDGDTGDSAVPPGSKQPKLSTSDEQEA